MQHKTILFISYDGMTDPLGQSQVIPYLQGLSKKGYHFVLLSCEKKEMFLQNEATVKTMLSGYNIVWEPIAYTKKPPVLSTLYDVLKLKNKARQLVKQHDIQMVHTRPGIPSLVGLWLKKKTGVKFLNDIREFYADSRVDGGMWDLKNPLYKTVFRLFKKNENEQLKNSDGIVCLTYAAEKIIKSWPIYPSGVPLSVIPCSVDTDLFNPSKISEGQKNALRAEMGIKEDELIFSYLGSIGGWYLTHEMLALCKRISTEFPKAKFLFISPHRHDEIIAKASGSGLDISKIITKKAARNQVPALVSLSSYSIFFIKPCFSKQSSSPTKHGEIMAMGIPVITNSGVGDVADIVKKYHSGIVINDFTAESFNQVAKELKEHKQYNNNEIREGGISFYALENAISKYHRLYQQIIP